MSLTGSIRKRHRDGSKKNHSISGHVLRHSLKPKHRGGSMYASTHNFQASEDYYMDEDDEVQTNCIRKMKAMNRDHCTGAVNLRRAMKALKQAKIDEHEPSFSSPHIQYFLASLCDLDLRPKNGGIRARCPLIDDVEKTVHKLNSFQTVNAEEYELGVVVSALKEFLNGINGGVFNELTSEFYEISLNSSLDITIMYLHSIIHSLPYIIQQFTYLLCKAFRNLVRLAGGQSVTNYTDLLMIFTPAIFPGSIADVTLFLRAARLLLVMVDHCTRVFLPLPLLDCDGKWYWLNNEFEEKAFVREILRSLRHLEAKLMLNDSGIELEESEEMCSSTDDNLSPELDFYETRKNLSHSFSLPDLYRFAYLDPED